MSFTNKCWFTWWIVEGIYLTPLSAVVLTCVRIFYFVGVSIFSDQRTHYFKSQLTIENVFIKIQSFFGLISLPVCVRLTYS